MNPNRYIANETKRWFSLAKKLRKEGRINEEFEVLLGDLSLEEVIGLKLELSSKTLNSPLFGLPIWNNLQEIVSDAVLKYSIGVTQTTSECARFLGMSQTNLYKLVKKYQIWNYFNPENFKKKKESDRIQTVDLTK